jgi:hypothetical protein
VSTEIHAAIFPVPEPKFFQFHSHARIVAK